MHSKVTTEPASEPITTAELKAHLRIDHSSEDSLLDEYITAARQIAEDYTARKFITQTITGYSDNFFSDSTAKDNWWSGVRVGSYRTHIMNGTGCLSLDWGPVSSITSIHTITDDGTETIYASSNYYLDNFDQDMIQKIRLKDNSNYPTSIRDHNGLKVVYVAGYGATGATVPAKLRHAIKMMATKIYENRGDCAGCEEKSGQVAILDTYKISRL